MPGRKHQLRIHCAEALGCPIVGDSVYGAARASNQQRQLRSLQRSAVCPKPDPPEGSQPLQSSASDDTCALDNLRQHEPQPFDGQPEHGSRGCTDLKHPESDMPSAADRQLLKASDSAFMAAYNESDDVSSDVRSTISLEAASRSTAINACITPHDARQPTACAESQPRDVKSMRVVSQSRSAPGQPSAALPDSSLAWGSRAHGLMEGRVTDLMLHARTLSISRPGQVSSGKFHVRPPFSPLQLKLQDHFHQSCEQLVPHLVTVAWCIQSALESYVVYWEKWIGRATSNCCCCRARMHATSAEHICPARTSSSRPDSRMQVQTRPESWPSSHAAEMVR